MHPTRQKTERVVTERPHLFWKGKGKAYNNHSTNCWCGKSAGKVLHGWNINPDDEYFWEWDSRDEYYGE